MSTEVRSTEALREARDKYVLGNFRQPRKLLFERGSGCRLWDTDGKEYLDAVSGTNGVALVGHSHPEVLAAVSSQFERLASHFFVHDSPPVIEFAERVSAIAPNSPSKTYLCPGGGEGIDAAVKLAMRITGRNEIVSLHGAYHGTSFAGMSLGGLPGLREWYPGATRWPNFQQVPSPDPYRPTVGENGDWRPAARALEATLDFGTYNNVAAVLLELVQGPNGHVEFPVEYVQEVRRICTKHDVLMIVDEVQTALARCGAYWASNVYDVSPDLIVIGKAWGGGYPFGGVVVRADLITPEIEASAWHILTFGNQPLQAAAALAVLNIVERDGLVERAAYLGERARGRFEEMAEQYDVIGNVRGPGLFIGVDMVEDRDTRVPAVAACAVGNDHAMDIGLLTWFGGAGNVMKFKPAVVSSDEDIDEMLDRCEDVIGVIDREVSGVKQAASATSV